VDGNKVKEYDASDYFGELALLKRQPRAVDVVADASPTKVLILDGDSFRRLLGNLSDLMAEKAKEYVGSSATTSHGPASLPPVLRAPPAKSPVAPALKQLSVKIDRAHNLINRDSGIWGDVSDPFVIVRFRGQERQTLEIADNLNPVWRKENEFVFDDVDEAAGSPVIELEVMDQNNVRAHQSLGRTRVLLSTLTDQWTHRREALEDGQKGELEFDIRLA
jgi:hypothetical protein